MGCLSHGRPVLHWTSSSARIVDWEARCSIPDQFSRHGQQSAHTSDRELQVTLWNLEQSVEAVFEETRAQLRQPCF
jgi:hypothetical protein